MLSVEFTGDTRVCHRCKEKWTDDTRGPWKVVISSTTKQIVDICPECFDYKSQREYRNSNSVLYKLNAPSVNLEASSVPAPLTATSSHTERVPSTRRLVINSQRGTGTHLAECRCCYLLILILDRSCPSQRHKFLNFSRWQSSLPCPQGLYQKPPQLFERNEPPSTESKWGDRNGTSLRHSASDYGPTGAQGRGYSQDAY